MQRSPDVSRLHLFPRPIESDVERLERADHVQASRDFQLLKVPHFARST
ncbi:hypothetical protein SH661x_003908 [Planctomicrobium sp. SH661]